jgi:hypothetical protein
VVAQTDLSLSLTRVSLTFEGLSSIRRHMLEPVRPEAVLPDRDRALCLATFSHFLIVKKNSFSLPLTLSHSLISGLFLSHSLHLSPPLSPSL